MSRPPFPAFPLCWLAGLLICAALSACKPREIPVACTPLPIVDGFETAMTKGGKMTLRLPKHAARLTEDCKQIDWAVLDYFWHKGKLIKRDANNQFDTNIPEISRDHVVAVYLTKGFYSLSEAKAISSGVQPWQVAHAVRHYKYPLEFYPRFYWSAPDKPPDKQHSNALWGVIGTKNPFSEYPFVTSCSIVRLSTDTVGNPVNGDFPKDYGDAKCRGGIAVVKGDKVIFGLIDVWANNAQYIDQIYNAAIAEIQTYIQE